MPTTIEFIANRLPRITAEDVRRFADTVDIRDAPGFAAQLQAFIHERVGAIKLPASFSGDRDSPAHPLKRGRPSGASSRHTPAHQPPVDATGETLEQTLMRKAAALRAQTRWMPNETDIQRGRAALLEMFNMPHNLPLAAFADLAGKSRQQIYKDIQARRLLTLNVGPRGQKLPDWQLDPVKQQLTQTVLQKAGDIDHWTIYRALSEPLEGLGGCSPVDVVTHGTIDTVTEAVFNVLGIRVN